MKNRDIMRIQRRFLNKDTTRNEKHETQRAYFNKPAAVIYPAHYFVQTKPFCACDGGCPRCRDLDTAAFPGNVKDNGRPLAAAERGYFEPRLGADFHMVRIHTDETTADCARNLHADAFTVGNHIFFGQDRYNPKTVNGKKLMAHELAHFVQQSTGRAGRQLQRRITVIDPNKRPPNHAIKWGDVVKGLFDTLCPDTTWSLSVNGDLTPADSKICDSSALSKSATGVSSGCVCYFLSTAGPHVEIEYDAAENNTLDVTKPNGVKTYRIRLTGKPDDVQGVSGNAPVKGSPLKKIPDPPWLILAHELCGHAKTTYPYLQSPKKPDEVENYFHEMTENRDKSAVDIENMIRKEHSAPGKDLGIRVGDFFDPDNNIHHGSVVRLPQAMQLLAFLRKLDVPVSKFKAKCTDQDLVYTQCPGVPRGGKFSGMDMLERVVYYTGWGRHLPYSCLWQVFPEGTYFAVEGIFWHITGKDDTKQAIAATWGVTMGGLNQANSVLSNGIDLLPDNAPLPAGISVIIPYKRAPGKQRYFFEPHTGPCER
jgi:hypothetical protein